MKMLVVALVLSGFVAASAHAAEMEFSKVDTDASEMISLEEAKAAGWEWDETQFAEADTDDDGELNQTEFLAASGQ